MKTIMFGNNKIQINTHKLGEAFATITSLGKVCNIYIDIVGVVKTTGDLIPSPKAIYRVLQEYDSIQPIFVKGEGSCIL